MSYGLSVQSSLGTIQIDEQYINVRMVQQGTFTTDSDRYAGFDLGRSYASPPLILVRPNAFGKYVGGMYYFKTGGGSGNDGVQFLGDANTTFSYAVFAIEGTAIDDGSTHGLRVWNSSNAITFNSAHTRARITHLYSVASSFNESTNYSYSLSGYSSIPWVVANTLYGFVSSGSESYVYSGFVVGFDSYNTMRIAYGSWDTSYWPTNGYAPTNQAPFPFSIAVAKINEGA